jgi:hypothetical protein
MAANPELLDKHLPYRYYSHELLDSRAARGHVVIPDLAPLP